MRVLFAAVVLLLSLSHGSLKHIESSSGVGIYGGSEVAIKEVPFMAIVYDHDHFCCGGAIIKEQYVLTAAHCCKGALEPAVVKHIKVGTDQRKKGGQTVKVAKVNMHPKYGVLHDYDSDICVLTLESKLQFSDTVHDIAMADEYFKLNEGDLLDTIGFGRIENHRLPEHLLKVTLPYAPNKRCDDIYQNKLNGKVTITDTMLCAGGVQGKGPCHGDSGSAIFKNNTLVGLSSFMDGTCADDGVPSVFARISALRSFVDGIISQGV